MMHTFHDDDIRAFITSAYTTLKSTRDIALSRLESSYRKMAPVMHRHLGEDTLDVSVLIYATLRLPVCIRETKRICIGQSEGIFKKHGVHVSRWTDVQAKARRRRYAYNRTTLAVFIASKSDIDDVLPTILSLQIEWNKAHEALKDAPDTLLESPEDNAKALASLLKITTQDMQKLILSWGDETAGYLKAFRDQPCSFKVRNFEASFSEYRRETERWWNSVAGRIPGLSDRPVYFVSSNTHSLINVLSGFAFSIKDEVIAYAASHGQLAEVLELWRKSQHTGDERMQRHILYYLLKKYEQSDPEGNITRRRLAHEEEVGIWRIESRKTLDVPAQVVDLGRLGEFHRESGMLPDAYMLPWKSDACIINIDYPLGRTAYFILSKIAEHLQRVLGVYIIGKAASLTAEVGDLLIPYTVTDLHTDNTFFISNCIHIHDISGILQGGCEVYDNQKAVTVLGTFLQNREMVNSMLLRGFTDIEMEAGPYLSAVYEMIFPKRYPEYDTIVLRDVEPELGIIHYVSDNPLRDRKLGDGSLSFGGIEATYTATEIVLAKMVSREHKRSMEQENRN